MRILLVEDEREVAEFLKAHLKMESFVVDIAEDGERGAYLGKTNTYCLILLDACLPKKAGIDVLKELRAHGIVEPIIVLSATTEAEAKITFLNAGADDYVVKTAPFRELLARIRAVRRRPQVIKEEIFSVGNLTLDVKRHVVTRGERAIYLTQKEFILLAYLMKHSGTALSRCAILEHVWDLNADPFSNTIEAHILNLRKKIHEEGEEELIHTIPKVGYKIAALRAASASY